MGSVWAATMVITESLENRQLHGVTRYQIRFNYVTIELDMLCDLFTECFFITVDDVKISRLVHLSTIQIYSGWTRESDRWTRTISLASRPPDWVSWESTYLPPLLNIP